MRPLVALLVLVTLAVSGCTGGSSSDQPAGAAAGVSPSGSPAPAPATSSGPPVVPPAPRAAACYRLTAARLTLPASSARPVACTGPHNARTIFVGRLRTIIRGHPASIDSPVVQRQPAGTCPRRLAAFVGGSATTRDLSRLAVVWYTPTPTQASLGARWFRCDLVAFASADGLLTLPATGLRGALSRAGALSTFGLCGTAAPGTRGFTRVICSRPHSWRAFDTVQLVGGRRYPGVAQVRASGDGTCKDRARSRAADTLKFTYGWEWPTGRQWAAGQHYGFCWVPG